MEAIACAHQGPTPSGNGNDNSDSTYERQTVINVRLFQYGEEALTTARVSRPKNTRKTYGGKQKEWAVHIYYFTIF